MIGPSRVWLAQRLQWSLLCCVPALLCPIGWAGLMIKCFVCPLLLYVVVASVYYDWIVVSVDISFKLTRSSR